LKGVELFSEHFAKINCTLLVEEAPFEFHANREIVQLAGTIPTIKVSKVFQVNSPTPIDMAPAMIANFLKFCIFVASDFYAAPFSVEFSDLLSSNCPLSRLTICLTQIIATLLALILLILGGGRDTVGRNIALEQRRA